jgi:hypothetical protein
MCPTPWSWIWREVRKATVAWIVGSVLLPYISTWVPGISKSMTAPISFTIINKGMTNPISFTVPLWVLVAIALLMIGSLVGNVRPLLDRRKAKEVHVCTYCSKVIGPGDKYMIIPHAPREVAHPDCYALNNRTSASVPATTRVGSPEVWPLILLKEVGTNMLLNRPISDKAQEHLGRLWQDFHSWEANVVSALSRLGAPETDISHFKTLKTFQARRLPAWNDAHSELLNMIAEKLDRLDEIAQRLEAR